MTQDSPERLAWLEARYTGIGGSEASSVFNVGYGCRRRLAYEKRRIEPDYPFDTTTVMRLGNLMEPFFADSYVEKTGRTVSSPSAFTHPKHPELRVNIDRLIAKTEGKRGRGVLEIKAQGRAAFYKSKREGLVEDYILQIQWGMMVTECEWGSFAIGCRDSGELLHWDVERDQSIIDEMLISGPVLWKLIKTEAAPLPDRLEIDDKRCAECQWRASCQGSALIRADHKGDLPYAEDIRPLLLQYDEVNARFCEKLPDGSKGTVDDLRMAEVKEELRSRLVEREAVAVAWPGGKDRKIYFRAQDGKVTWQTDDLVRRYEYLRQRLRILTVQAGSDIEQFDAENPPAEKYKRVGVPFRSLRIF